MADELAKVLTIPDSVTQKMDDVIEKITEIESASNKMATTVNQAFKSMANGDVDQFLQKLINTQAAMTAISATTIRVDSKAVTDAATDAEKLANAMSNVAQSAQKLGTSAQLTQQIADAVALYKQLQAQVEKFDRQKASGSNTDITHSMAENAKEEMRILEEQIAVWKDKLNKIEQSNTLFREQIALLNGETVEMQRSAHILSQMSAYYKEMEKSSLASANADQKKATDAEKQYNSLQSRLTALQKKYDEIRMAEPFEGQEKAVEGYKTEISRVERELKRLEREFPNIKTFSDQTWDAKRILNYAAQVEAVHKRLRKQYDNTAKAYREANLKTLNTPEGALNFASSANTYARQVKAIQFLENAYKSLGKTEAEVAKKNEIARAMRDLKQSVRDADEQMGKFKDSARGLFNYSEQLSRAFSLLFSVSQIRGYIREIKNVTAEFELQRVALGSLLQSQDKANQLFGQITNLAVRSPFTIKELNTYTKQLAAYNIQYESLFDTTKMLADVSAGLGVDIGRLILAFGQVKAATVLRGTEVRQFTEAGFGILNELATYYTELEGRLVSVGDVQDRITKKMVKFADVEEIFKRVTSAGGMFYNMQEKMAETLYGRWSNLTDRIDLMLNEIGQNNKGLFNAMISLTAGLAEHWEAVAVALQLAIPAFISFKAETALAGKGLKWFGKEASVTSFAIKGLTTAFKSLVSPLSLMIMGFEAAMFVWNKVSHEIEQTDKRLQTFNASMSSLNSALNKIKQVEQAEQLANESDEKFAERLYENKKKALQSLRSEVANLGVEINDLPDIKTLKPKQVDEEIKMLEQRAKSYINFSNQIKFAFNQGDDWWKFWLDGFYSLDSAATTVESSSAKVFSALEYNLSQASKILESFKDQIDPDLYREFSEGLTQKKGEDEITFLNRINDTVIKLRQSLNLLEWDNITDGAKQFNALRKNLKDFNFAFSDLMGDLPHFKGRVGTLMNSLAKEFHTSLDGMQAIAQQNELAVKMAIDDHLARQSWSEFVKNIARQVIYVKLGFKKDERTGGDKTPLDDWQKDIVSMQNIFSYDDDKIRQFATYEDFLDSIQRKYSDNIKILEEYNGTTAKGTNLVQKWRDSSKADAEAAVELAEKQAAAVGLELKKEKERTDRGKERNDYLKESISLIQKMGKEYDEALKYMGEKAATTDISTRYSSLLTDLASKASMDTGFIADLTFNTEGIIAGLKKIADAAAKAGATEAEETAREAIAKLEGDKVKLTAEIDIDTLENEIDDFFSKYNMGKELSKLGLGKELTSSLFNFEFVDLDDARRSLEEWRKQHLDTNGNLGKDYQEAYNKAQRQITEAERKELDDRIKMYHKYLKQSMSDAVAVKLEEARQLADIEKMAIDESYKAQLRQGVKRDTAEKYDKAKWEEFKNTDMYIRMFEDLDYMSTASLNRLKDKLIEVKDSLHNLSPENLKEIQSRFEEIDEVIRQRSPFKQLAKDMRAIKGLEAAGETREVLEAQMAQAEVQMSANQQKIEFLEKYIGLKQQGLSLDNLTAEERAKIARYEEYGIELAKEDLGVAKGMYSYYEKIFGTASGKVTLWKDLGKDLEASKTKLQTWREVWGRVADTASEALEMMGAEADGIGQTFIALGATLFDIGLATVQQAINFKAMGIAANSSLGIIGWIAIALQTVVSLMSALFKMHDNRLENQIERELGLIDELQKKYEKLEEAIENAYSMDTYDRAQYQAEKNLEAQNEALNRAIAAEEDKKKTDSDRIKEWQEQYEENLKKIAELRQNAIGAYGGFGTSDNIKSAAEDFVSAWLNAFNETGNGLDGLSEQMDEWLNNAIQKQLLMRLSSQYITPLLEQFDDMFSETSDNGRVMTKEEIEAWKRLYEQNSKEFDEKAKAYLEALNIKPTGTESELSGLQRGIEGVTETTAQALEALLNSIRYYVSDTNGLIRQLYASFMSPDEAINPMLYELKQHTTLLNAIHSLLNSTTKMTNNNGRALKVLMM